MKPTHDLFGKPVLTFPCSSDGETRIIGVGEIILIEDVHGKGHLSRAVGKMRRSVMIPVD
jgi:hypothetical protein